MKQEGKERSSTIYIGKGIIISALVITAALGFTLGFFVGKTFRPVIAETPAANQSNALQAVPPAASVPAVPEPAETQPPQEPVQSEAAKNIQSSGPKGSAEQPVKAQKPQQASDIKTVPAPPKEQEKTGQSQTANIGATNKNGKAHKYTVQVEAFKSSSTAEALAEKLTKKGYKATVVPSEKKKREKLYKVIVGEFATRKEADLLSIKLHKTENMQHAFVTFRK